MSRFVIRGVGVSTALLTLLVACATGEPGDDVGGFEAADPNGPDASSKSDSSFPHSDGGNRSDPPDDTTDGGTDHEDGGELPCTGTVVINELMPEGVQGGNTNVEFIELYNPSDCTISLAGWKLRYRSRENKPGFDLYTFEPGYTLAKKAFFVLGNDKFTGKKDRSFNTGAGLGNAGGQVGLVDDVGTLVDAVGYGPTSGDYTEGTPTPLPDAGSSLGRKTDGVDTDNNIADFKVFAQHSAGAPN